MIPRLEDLSIGHRVALTAAIVIILLLLMAMAGYLSGRWQEAQAQVPPSGPSKYDEEMLELDKQSLRQAYQAQTALLFSVWLKDDITTTVRVETGLRIARRAFVHAANQIEKRGDELAKRK